MSIKSLFDGNNESATSRKDLPKAKFWLNIGYTASTVVNNPETGEPEQVDRFVSLPVGLAIDTMSPLALGNTSNADWNAFQTARNDLLDQVQNKAMELKAGEECIVKGICIQLRRVAEAVAPVLPTDNQYSRDVFADPVQVTEEVE